MNRNVATEANEGANSVTEAGRLKASEARWRAIFDQHHQLAGVLTADGILLAANRTALNLIGATPEQVLGKPFWETPWWAHSPELQRQLRAAIDEAARGNIVRFEAQHPRPDGSMAIVDFSIRPVCDEVGKVTLLIPESVDITEHRRAMGDLYRREQRLQALINTTQDAVVFIDAEARIVQFNPAAERVFGYSVAEVVGCKVNMLMPPPYSVEHDGYIQRYEATGQPRAIGRIRSVTARRKNGEEFPIELSVTEVRVDEEVRYGAFIRDISEKTRLQQELVEKERLAVIGTTAATFAHEVGNPLNNMHLRVQLLERHALRDGLDDKILGGLRTIKDEIHRLNGLLREFRALARRQDLQLETIDLKNVIDLVVDLHLEAGVNPDVRVRREVAPELPAIKASSEKLQQVLLNLCKNAVEAMPQGGELLIRAQGDRERVVIEVSDMGVGIPADLDVFQPFKTTKPHGTGLGLAVVRHLVELHGGNVSYRSKANEGTTFTLVLPIEPPTPKSD
jgi:two-component system sensor kinase FixL